MTADARTELVVLDLFGTLVAPASGGDVLATLQSEGAVVAEEAEPWLVEGMPAAPALVEMGISPRAVVELNLTGRFESVGAFVDAVRHTFPDAPPPSSESVGIGERAALLSLRGAHMIEEATSLIEALQRRVALQLVSDCSWQSARVIEALGLTRWFPEPLLSCELGRLKRDGVAFDTARERAGCAADRTLVVGDSWHNDVLGALAAGMRAILLDRSGRHPCHMLLDDLGPLLGRSPRGDVVVRAEVRAVLDDVLPVAVEVIERDSPAHLEVDHAGRVTLRALRHVAVATTLADALEPLLTA